MKKTYLPREIEKLEEIYEDQAVEKARTSLSLAAFPMLVQKTKFGPAYPKCVENIFVILTHHPDFSGKFRFDAWTNKMEIKKKETWHELEDADIVPIQRMIQRLYTQFATIGKEVILDAVYDACRAKTFDRAIDYIRSLEWDMKPRLDSWISTVYGTKDTDYTRAVGANFFKGMAKRIIEPGCKFDTVMIL